MIGWSMSLPFPGERVHHHRLNDVLRNASGGLDMQIGVKLVSMSIASRARLKKLIPKRLIIHKCDVVIEPKRLEQCKKSSSRWDRLT